VLVDRQVEHLLGFLLLEVGRRRRFDLVAVDVALGARAALADPTVAAA
jgi:hypothetical protein